MTSRSGSCETPRRIGDGRDGRTDRAPSALLVGNLRFPARECILGESELSMWQLQQNLVRPILGKENCALSTARWLVTQFVSRSPMPPGIRIEALARNRAKVIMAAVGIRPADTSYDLEIVATGTKPFADLLDTLKAVPAVSGGVLPIVRWPQELHRLDSKLRGKKGYSRSL